jgi:2'-5' RNA ligase
MRLFLAVELGQQVRAAAVEAALAIQRRLDPDVHARWLPAEKMHLTVRFIGFVEDSRVRGVLQALQPPLPIAPFDVELGTCGVFPRSGPPRVFWIGLSQGLTQLQQMHAEFNRRLLSLGIAQDERSFTAHLTLARVKDAPREVSRATRDLVSATRVAPAHCRVGAATLFQSVLSPEGSTYARLLDVPLTANR